MPVWERQRHPCYAGVLQLLVLIFFRDEYSAVSHHQRQIKAARFDLRDTSKIKRDDIESIPNWYLCCKDHSVTHDSNFGGLKVPENRPKSAMQHKRMLRKLCFMSGISFKRNGKVDVEDFLVVDKEIWCFILLAEILLITVKALGASRRGTLLFLLLAPARRSRLSVYLTTSQISLFSAGISGFIYLTIL